MKTWIISDTHFGHKNILTFKRKDGTLLRPGFQDINHMDFTMINNWNSVVGLEDKVYHLGDVAICAPAWFKMIMSHLNGRKVLIKGNHDTLKLSQYSEWFYDIRGYHVLDGILLAHIPIHPDSLGRYHGQIHGHMHDKTVPDKRYVCVSVEQINYTPVDFEEIKKRF